ncbi:YoaK family protein [Dongia soli]|uniref:YoaK family protein n=1 Tax=Dongia soli TaxID=600628 RepID=A0ABU5E5V9_9PROT|nr:YoaK family protein [Dongia soli]MDY0881534.1 YoaK family protein [Dongia soli]
MVVFDQRHGPLPLYLLALTILTGLVDAASYLGLGHVFVANMTGNVVFLGFAAARITGFSVTASLVAIAAFMAGALCGGVIGRAKDGHRGRILWIAIGMETCLAGAALVMILERERMAADLSILLIIVTLSIAMGLQNSIVRRLAVPDLTTTVLTLTITGLAADRGAATGAVTRRFSSVICMFAGAAAGGTLMLVLDLKATLIAAFVLLLGVFVTAFGIRNSTAAWTKIP